jgi:signal transduction histidine kinase
MEKDLRMLHEFLNHYRDAIIAKTRDKVRQRPWPLPSASEIEHGVPLFLTQLSDTLQAGTTPFLPNAIGASATRHGRELLAQGFSVSQVVQDYGDICQAVTEIAIEHGVPITTEEFRTLNACLDTAIAQAVTEHARITAESRSTEETERLGQLAHEIKNMLNTALLAFEVVKRGTVGINGSTGAVLGRSLAALRDLVESAMSDTRLAANHQRRERVSVDAFLKDIVIASGLHAEDRGLQFVTEAIDPALGVHVDPQLLASAVTNLLNNAFKYTRAGGRIVLRAHQDRSRLRIEVEDECGGIPDTQEDPFQPFGNRRGKDRTGLGLGLSIARRAVRAHGGDIAIRNMPGKGCTFVIDVPLAAAEAAVAETPA